MSQCNRNPKKKRIWNADRSVDRGYRLYRELPVTSGQSVPFLGDFRAGPGWGTFSKRAFLTTVAEYRSGQQDQATVAEYRSGQQDLTSQEGMSLANLEGPRTCLPKHLQILTLTHSLNSSQEFNNSCLNCNIFNAKLCMYCVYKFYENGHFSGGGAKFNFVECPRGDRGEGANGPKVIC